MLAYPVCELAFWHIASGQREKCDQHVGIGRLEVVPVDPEGTSPSRGSRCACCHLRTDGCGRARMHAATGSGRVRQSLSCLVADMADTRTLDWRTKAR
jgi:hypothetical protein